MGDTAGEGGLEQEVYELGRPRFEFVRKKAKGEGVERKWEFGRKGWDVAGAGMGDAVYLKGLERWRRD